MRVNPVSVWMALTVADGTRAPLGSITAPRMLAVVSWARSTQGDSKINSVLAQTHLRSVSI
jgi:hypothetical protein